jgi:hypothetical protein
MGTIMKILVAVAAIAALIASPVIAEAAKRKPPAAKTQVQKPQKQKAQFSAIRARTHSTNPGHDVYREGVYVGSDPDPHIRSKLIQDRWDNADP